MENLTCCARLAGCAALVFAIEPAETSFFLEPRDAGSLRAAWRPPARGRLSALSRNAGAADHFRLPDNAVAELGGRSCERG